MLLQQRERAGGAGLVYSLKETTPPPSPTRQTLPRHIPGKLQQRCIVGKGDEATWRKRSVLCVEKKGKEAGGWWRREGGFQRDKEGEMGGGCCYTEGPAGELGLVQSQRSRC